MRMIKILNEYQYKIISKKIENKKDEFLYKFFFEVIENAK